MVDFRHSKLLDAIWTHAEQNSTKIALVWNGEQITYGQLRQKIACVALYLQSQGVHSGDCLGIIARKGLDFVYLYFVACFSYHSHKNTENRCYIRKEQC